MGGSRDVGAILSAAAGADGLSALPEEAKTAGRPAMTERQGPTTTAAGGCSQQVENETGGGYGLLSLPSAPSTPTGREAVSLVAAAEVLEWQQRCRLVGISRLRGRQSEEQ